MAQHYRCHDWPVIWGSACGRTKQSKVPSDACLALGLQFSSQPLLHLNLHYGRECCPSGIGSASGHAKSCQPFVACRLVLPLASHSEGGGVVIYL